MGLILAAALAGSPATAMDRPVEIGSGAQTLYGSLTVPSDQAAPVAVLLIGGSGPADRNGDDLKAGARGQALKRLAFALAKSGVASLRYDKRGVGESTPAGVPTSIHQLAEDAVAWKGFLERQPGIRCVVIVGHSEGALIGALAAQTSPPCGLVLVSAASQNLGDLIEAQGPSVHRPPEVSARIHDIVLALRSGRPVGEVPAGYEGVFGPEVVDYTRSQISLDPVTELAKVKAPVLVIQGDNDLQETVYSAERLAAAVHIRPVIIEGMTHALKRAPNDLKANIDTYLNPDLPLAPGFAEAVTRFVLSER